MARNLFFFFYNISFAFRYVTYHIKTHHESTMLNLFEPTVVRNVVILENGSTTTQQLQKQIEQQQNATSTTTTTTVTEVHSVNGGNSAPKSSNNTVTTVRKHNSLANGKAGDVVDSDAALRQKLAKLNLNDTLMTTGTNTQVTQQLQKINGVNGESGEMVTTTVRTVSNGYKEEGNKKIQAKGSADVKHSNAATGSCNTVVSADGSTTTTVKSAKSSSVKYAVEASSIQEEIIR